MDVYHVMTRDVKFAGLRNTLADVARLMRDNGCGAVPVVDGERVVGMITDRDVCLAMAEATQPASLIGVAQVMSRPVYCCEPEEDVATALETMGEKKVRRLPVVDEHGTLRGILSIDDAVLRIASGNGETVRALKAICARPSAERPLPG